MNKLFVVLCFGLAACNYDVGECWVRGEGNEGAGGSIISPTGGDGAFGYVPARPQNAPVGSGASEAMAGCTPDCLEACKEKCDRVLELCRDNCPRRDTSCLKKCMDEYSRCLVDCDKRCK
jgi:hypothetical protein